MCPRHASGPDAVAPQTSGERRRSPSKRRGNGERHCAAAIAALVAELAGRGVLDDLPGKTTGEERVEVAQAMPSAGEQFREATTLFDDAWYGDAPTGPAEAARLKDLSQAVLEEAPR